MMNIYQIEKHKEIEHYMDKYVHKIQLKLVHIQ